jgi:Ribosomal protein L19e
LYRDGLIIKKPTVVHSRARVTLRNEAKRKGRHTGKSFYALQISAPREIFPAILVSSNGS